MFLGKGRFPKYFWAVVDLIQGYCFFKATDKSISFFLHDTTGNKTDACLCGYHKTMLYLKLQEQCVLKLRLFI